MSMVSLQITLGSLVHGQHFESVNAGVIFHRRAGANIHHHG
jgi:hypothetical protein